jgi:hypothetical protein
MPPQPPPRRLDLSREARFLIVPLLYALVRLLVAPRVYDEYATLYPLIVEFGTTNAHEIFHPLYVPILQLLGRLAVLVGYTGLSLPVFQFFSLAGAVAQLWLVSRIAFEIFGELRPAIAAAGVATASQNLWFWSMQTMPYTWAAAALLGCAWALMRARSFTPREAAGLGILTGLAVGLNVACVALVPVVLIEMYLSEKNGRRAAEPAALYLGLSLCGALAAFAPFVLMGRYPHGAIFERVWNSSVDMEPFYQTRSVSWQLRELFAAGVPEDMPLWILTAFFALLSWTAWRKNGWPGPQRKAVRVGALLFAAVAVFFFLNDPRNRFLFSAALLFPVLVVVALSRLGRPAAAAALVWAALVARNAFFSAAYLPASNPGFDEARFVRGRLGPRDLLLALAAPDWFFTYALHGAVPVARLRGRGERDDAADAYAPGPDLNARLRRTLCSGGRVVLASDALFRPGNLSPEDFDAAASALLAGLRGDFALGEPLVSPAGQHYYPISLKRAAACP